MSDLADSLVIATGQPLQTGRRPIGIIAGSGPQAGVDLWSKVLQQNQQRLGVLYRGDLDAPEVVIRSDPLLGLSMELAQNEEVVWERLRLAAVATADSTAAYAVACNTLNYFATRLQALDLPSELVSFQSEARALVELQGLSRLCLLGSAPVTAMNGWSAYDGLQKLVDVEAVHDPAGLHRLIYDIKARGTADPSLKRRFREILHGIESDVVLLACTELPLIADIETDKQLVDVTDLVAAALVERSFAGH